MRAAPAEPPRADVAPAVTAAAENRLPRKAPAHGAAPGSADNGDEGAGTRLLPALRASVRAEVLAGAVVLAVTGFLVSRQPATDAYAPSFTDRAPAGPNTAVVTVEQTRIGAETVRLRVIDTATGAPVAAQSAAGQLALPDRDLGPFQVRMLPTGQAGGFTGRLAVPAAGQWELLFTIQLDPLTAYVTTSFYTVR
jgi:hypothetical protein